MTRLRISNDRSELDLDLIHRFLSREAYWNGLYAQFGFAALARPQTLMEILRPDIYQSAAASA